jgi:cytochrome c553
MFQNMPHARPRPARRRVSLLLPGAVFAVALLVGAARPGRPAPADAALPARASDAQIASFESKIRPVLVAQCVSCHGPSQQLGGVRLDRPADILKTLTAGDSDHSRLIQAIRYAGDVKMPPTGKRPDAEIAMLTAWVKDGAPMPAPSGPMSTLPANWEARKKYWAFQPVRRTPVPKVHNAAWAATPIDHYILAALEAKGFKPAPAADRRTLIRRAYFDLIGLPPTPEAVDAFVADRSPNAWPKVVDGLLANPHFGERWARHWLDVARYADSNGLDENIAFGNAWRYRDYVVNAFNKDKPYDAFLQEQIAGDLLDSKGDDALRNERITATCFLTMGPKVLAEPDKAKMAMDIIDEQIDVTSKAVMGLTISCARCHDHKFDPISTKDYYALAGVFKSTRTMQSLNTVAHVYERPLDSPTIEAAIKAHTEAVKPLEMAVAAAKKSADAGLAARLVKDADRYLAGGIELARTPGVLLPLAETPQKPGDPERKLIEATSFVRGNAVRDTDNFGKGIGVIITNASPVSAEWDVAVAAAGSYQLELRYAALESRPVAILINGKSVAKDAAGDVTGSWYLDGQRWEAEGVYELKAGVNKIKIERKDGAFPHISRLLLIATAPSVKPASRKETDRVAAEIGKRDGLVPAILVRCAARTLGATDLASAQQRVAGDSALFLAPEKSEMFWPDADKAAVKAATDALALANKDMPTIPIAQSVEDTMKPEDVRVHIRGSTENLGDLVPRGFPAILVSSRTPKVEPNGSGRLAMARWLTSPDHPLTARVGANRIWQHLFGIGLVATADNWGLRGETPSNPALLDYLASTFSHEDAWSQKSLIRQVMLSATYRQACSSPNDAVAARTDPENLLLYRQNRERLEAEPYRDAILAVSGQLDLTMGGSLLTTADHDYVTNDQSADKAAYAAPRRSIYLPVIRNSLFDMFQAFDFGDGSTVNGRRAVTVVAPQALFALNSPMVRDAAAGFARRTLAEPATDDGQRIRRAYRTALGRSATAAETTRVAGYIARYTAATATIEPDPAKRRERAWQSFCQALLSSNEFLYVD